MHFEYGVAALASDYSRCFVGSNIAYFRHNHLAHQPITVMTSSILLPPPLPPSRTFARSQSMVFTSSGVRVPSTTPPSRPYRNKCIPTSWRDCSSGYCPPAISHSTRRTGSNNIGRRCHCYVRIRFSSPLVEWVYSSRYTLTQTTMTVHIHVQLFHNK